MIYKWIRELVAKYSFVTGCELKGGFVLIYYKKDGELQFKKLPLRANKTQLERVIKKIKEESDYGLQKEERKKVIQTTIRTKPVMVFS